MRVILSELERLERVSVDELAKLLGVSKVTIRGDLAALQRQGLVHRTRGGAVRPFAQRSELPLEQTRKQLALEKRRIGEYAASLIGEGDTVFLDVGSTATEVARSLPAGLRHLTVVTAGLNVAAELEKHPGVTVVVTGGTLRRLQHSLVNPFGALLLSSLHADKLFLGCNGVDLAAGVTNRNLEEAEIKRSMVEHARETYVLADHRKLGQVSTAAVAPLSKVTGLITDKGAGEAQLSELRAAGLRVTAV